MWRPPVLPDADAVTRGLARVRRAHGVPSAFPTAALGEASRITDRRPDRRDRRDVELVTVDPPRSMDLDQAVGVTRDGDEHVVHYAIADLGALVEPGGAIDTEARRRGVTTYLPDGPVGLHPPALGEGAASLLPGQDRPAVLWRMRLDDTGDVVDVDVEAALVRSRARRSYADVQRDLDDPAPSELAAGLGAVGRLRARRARARGAVHLPLPSQEVVTTDGAYALEYRSPLPVEDHNAQISLMTGLCAAAAQGRAGRGLLRTLPTPDPASLAELARAAHGLRVPWPPGRSYQDLLAGLDPTAAPQAALLTEARTLLRGAGYRSFRGELPADGVHSAIAGHYAHATAPIRRLCDRFVNEVVLAEAAGSTVPGWVDDALDELPSIMGSAAARIGRIERDVVDLVEAVVLRSHVGAVLDAVVVDERGDDLVVQLRDPAIVARARGVDGVAPGRDVEVVVAEVDVDAAEVHLEVRA